MWRRQEWGPPRMEQPESRKIHYEDSFERKWSFHEKGRYAASFDISPERWRIFIFDIYTRSSYVYLDCPGPGRRQVFGEEFYTFYWFGKFLVVLHGQYGEPVHYLIFKVDHEKRNVQVIETNPKQFTRCCTLQGRKNLERQSLTPSDFVVARGYEFIAIIRKFCLGLVSRNPFIKGPSNQMSLDFTMSHGGFREFNRSGGFENFQDCPFVSGSSVYSMRSITLPDQKKQVFVDRLIRFDLTKKRNGGLFICPRSDLYQQRENKNVITQEMFENNNGDVSYVCDEEYKNMLSMGYQVTLIKRENGKHSLAIFDIKTKRVYHHVEDAIQNYTFVNHPWHSLLKMGYKKVTGENEEKSYELTCSQLKIPINKVQSLKNLAKSKIAFDENRRICDEITEKQANILFFE